MDDAGRIIIIEVWGETERNDDFVVGRRMVWVKVFGGEGVEKNKLNTNGLLTQHVCVFDFGTWRLLFFGRFNSLVPLEQMFELNSYGSKYRSHS